MKDIRIAKIKTWEQMEEEFGSTPDGRIKTEESFLDVMEKHMPKNRIIVLEDDSWADGVSRLAWSMSDDMIEEELNPEDYPQYLI